jgi:hypothetical protein
MRHCYAPSPSRPARGNPAPPISARHPVPRGPRGRSPLAPLATTTTPAAQTGLLYPGPLPGKTAESGAFVLCWKNLASGQLPAPSSQHRHAICICMRYQHQTGVGAFAREPGPGPCGSPCRPFAAFRAPAGPSPSTFASWRCV